MSTAVVRTQLATANMLGEGIVWCPRRQALYWTDIPAATLWRHDPATQRTDAWPMPERLACIALCADPDWLLLGLASRLAFLHLPDGALEPIAEVEPDLPTRLNDAACDRQGRFVFGTLDESDPQRPIGSFYRLDADLSLHRLDLERIAISNSLAFSPSGDTLYYCDTPTGRIRCCEYGADGRVGAPRDFADLGDVDGGPDGSAIDAEGGLWNAQWGLGRVTRYRPDGRVDRHIELPARQPTRPAFGGPELGTMYVTSAREGLHLIDGCSDAADGHLFAVDTGVRGLPEPVFAGVPRTRNAP